MAGQSGKTRVDEGTEDSKKEFCSAILAVVESEEAREYPRGRRPRNPIGHQPPHLAKLLREFEADNIIERHPAGRHVYVSLGIIGELLAEQHAPALPDRDIRETVLDIPASSPCLVAINFRPRKLLAIQ